MGLDKTSSVVASCGRAASAARSTTTQSLARTQTCGRPGQGPQPGVLYIDRGVIVLNKPPGLVSQGTSSIAAPVAAKSPSHLQNTTTRTLPTRTAFDDVLDGLRRAYDLGTNPYPVHRLDKGTTGVLVLARTKALARELSQQFRARAIDKSYLALVHADARSFPATRKGLIDASLGFDDGRVRLGVQAQAPANGNNSGVQAALQLAVAELPGSGGKVAAARTTWEVLASSDIAPLSLVRLYPHTGLKHQLRVHMAHALKVPILGDALYGGALTASLHFSTYAGVIPENRLFLHSSSISFWRYRRKGLNKRFRLTISAPLPADFVEICRDMNLSLPKDVIEGGAFVDGERLLGDEIPDVEGRWLGDHSPCNRHCR